MNDTAAQDALFQASVEATAANLDRLITENKRLRKLVSDAAMLVACQPPSRHTAKWLQEAEELGCG